MIPLSDPYRDYPQCCQDTLHEEISLGAGREAHTGVIAGGCTIRHLDVIACGLCVMDGFYESVGPIRKGGLGREATRDERQEEGGGKKWLLTVPRDHLLGSLDALGSIVRAVYGSFSPRRASSCCWSR